MCLGQCGQEEGSARPCHSPPGTGEGGQGTDGERGRSDQWGGKGCRGPSGCPSKGGQCEFGDSTLLMTMVMFLFLAWITVIVC